MKWPQRDEDNQLSGRMVIASVITAPLITFAVAYALGCVMAWWVFPPSQVFSAMDMAIGVTAVTTFFFWLLLAMMYYGPGKAATREEWRQSIRQEIQDYGDRYPDALPPADEFLH